MKAGKVQSRQFLIFITGGFLSALIDVGTLIFLLKIDATTLIATTGGFVLAFLFNYMFNAQLTFAAQKTVKSFFYFIIIVIVNYIITIMFVLAANNLDVNVVVGKLVSLPFVALNGFFLSKYWVFK